MQVVADEIALSLAPEALQILIQTPVAIACIMKAKEKPSQPGEDAPQVGVHESVAREIADVDEMVTLQRASNFVRDVLGDSTAAVRCVQRISKQLTVNVRLELSTLEIVLADSIVPVLRLHAKPSATFLYYQSTPSVLLFELENLVFEMECLTKTWEPTVEPFRFCAQASGGKCGLDPCATCLTCYRLNAGLRVRGSPPT